MVPPADWIENERLYGDMLAYLRTYPYFTSPQLRHTLMLGEISNAIAIGYPETWHTIQNEMLGRLIVPNIINPPYIRIYEPDTEVALSDYVSDTYNLKISVDVAPGVFEFQNIDGRSGYVTFADLGYMGAHVIEYSAPIVQFDSYDLVLRQMAESLIRFSTDE